MCEMSCYHCSRKMTARSDRFDIDPDADQGYPRLIRMPRKPIYICPKCRRKYEDGKRQD